MELEIKGLSKKMQYQLGKYETEVGLLSDTARKEPKYGAFKQYAGKTLLQISHKKSTVTNVQVAEKLDKQYKWLASPFLNPNNKEVVDVVNEIVADMNQQGDKQRILNGMRAVVRNPILRGEYGKNSAKWAAVKGFNDLLMMTGQFFKAIEARFKK